ncbi:MAG: hypothetical protein DCC67_02260 [Planctomycetota bacterium]|nr:MAG: hypothetical protein DCC67_02260 [Planctomycetota bacterium]
MSTRIIATGLVAAGLLAGTPQSFAHADGPYRRVISYQNKQDLFYNNYEGPNPSGVPVAMYPSPRPVPVHVGHTYFTYQPFYPQEYLYKHTRSHYAYHPGCGWSRAKVRYRTGGLWLDHWWWNMKGDADIWPHQ